MLKINLETELRKQGRVNAREAKAQELILREANQILSNAGEHDMDTLKRIGLSTNVEQAKNIIAKQHMFNEKTKHLEQDKIFTEQQIKSLCIKYRLRFLDAKHYKGNVDALVPQKVREFESVYNPPIPQGYRNAPGIEYKICAPASSFRLQQRPKDPLLFAYLGEDKWYLVHKWGNDLSWFRMVLGFFDSQKAKLISTATITICAFIVFQIFTFSLSLSIPTYSGIAFGFFLSVAAGFIIALIYWVIDSASDFEFSDWIDSLFRDDEKWNSQFKN